MVTVLLAGTSSISESTSTAMSENVAVPRIAVRPLVEAVAERDSSSLPVPNALSLNAKSVASPEVAHDPPSGAVRTPSATPAVVPTNASNAEETPGEYVYADRATPYPSA
jgi:hypothetical protein